MRHKDARNRLKQKPAHARMIKRNLITSLLLYESVRTTKSRAKAIAPMVDRLIRNAKKQLPHNAIRSLNAVVTDKNACRKVMEVLVKRYEKRSSGLTRIKAVGARTGDGASLVDISLVDGEIVAMPVKEEKKKVTKKAAPKKETAKKEEKKTTKKATPKKK